MIFVSMVYYSIILLNSKLPIKTHYIIIIFLITQQSFTKLVLFHSLFKVFEKLHDIIYHMVVICR